MTVGIITRLRYVDEKKEWSLSFDTKDECGKDTRIFWKSRIFSVRANGRHAWWTSVGIFWGISDSDANDIHNLKKKTYL